MRKSVIVKTMSYGLISIGLAFGTVACGSPATVPSSTPAVESREASWWHDPFRMCIQNLTSRDMIYAKTKTLRSGAVACAVSVSGGSFESSAISVVDPSEDKIVEFKVNNAIAGFRWQYSYRGWEDFLGGATGSEFYTLQPGTSQNVVVGPWNVTSSVRQNLEVVRDGEKGYAVDFRFTDK